MTWTKVWRDFTARKIRTLLVILSIAVGVMAISTVFGSRDALLPQMEEGFARTNPADITAFVDGVSAELIADLATLDGIAVAEGEFYIQTRWQIDGQWQPIAIEAGAETVDRAIRKIPLTGGTAPGTGEIVMEAQTTRIAAVQFADELVIESLSGEEKSATLTGFVYDPNNPSPTVSGTALGYMTMETAETLFGATGFNRIRITIEDDTQQAAIRDSVETWLADHAGVQVFDVSQRDLATFPGKESVDALLQLMGGIGGLSLLLSAFLVVNTISTILASEVQHIGTMKAIGATRQTVMRSYLMLIAGYGILGSLFGLVLGIIGLNALTRFIADLGNIQISGISVPPTALGMGAAIGLLIPILAALAPIWQATGVTVREAMFSYGLQGGGIGAGLLPLINRLPFLVSMSLRNLFRSKSRTVFTLLTLTLAGVTFIAVQTTGHSLRYTLDRFSKTYDADLVYYTSDGYLDAETLIGVADEIAGIDVVEAWSSGSFEQDAQDPITVLGIPQTTKTYAYADALLDGRWFNVGETGVAVLPERYAIDNEIAVGDVVNGTIAGQFYSAEIVGIMRDFNNEGRQLIVPLAELAPLVSAENQANQVRLRTVERTPDALGATTTELIDRGGELDMTVFVVDWQSRASQSAETFDIIVLFLMVMVALVTIVSALGLIGTITINVTERMKEIGVMRAVGASSRAVSQVFWLEGILLGLISWVFALLLGYPVARAFTQVITDLLVPVEFSFPPISMLTVGLGLVAVAVLAGLLPAASAARARVSDIIRYG